MLTGRCTGGSQSWVNSSPRKSPPNRWPYQIPTRGISSDLQMILLYTCEGPVSEKHREKWEQKPWPLSLGERRDDEKVGAVNTDFKERNPAVTRAAWGGEGWHCVPVHLENGRVCGCAKVRGLVEKDGWRRQNERCPMELGFRRGTDLTPSSP